MKISSVSSTNVAVGKSSAIVAMIGRALQYYGRSGFIWYVVPLASLLVVCGLLVYWEGAKETKLILPAAVFFMNACMAAFGFAMIRLYGSFSIRLAPKYMQTFWLSLLVAALVVSIIPGAVVSQFVAINTGYTVFMLMVLNVFVIGGFFGKYRLIRTIIVFFILMFSLDYVKDNLYPMDDGVASAINTVVFSLTSTYMVIVFSISIELSWRMLSRQSKNGNGLAGSFCASPKFFGLGYSLYCLIFYRGKRFPFWKLGVNPKKYWKSLRFATLDSDEFSILLGSSLVLILVPILVVLKKGVGNPSVELGMWVMIMGGLWSIVGSVAMYTYLTTINYRRLYLQSPLSNLSEFLKQMVKVIWYRVLWSIVFISGFVLYFSLMFRQEIWYVIPISVFAMCCNTVFLLWVASTNTSSFTKKVKENYRTYVSAISIIPAFLSMGTVCLAAYFGVTPVLYLVLIVTMLAALFLMHKSLLNWSRSDLEY